MVVSPGHSSDLTNWILPLSLATSALSPEIQG